MATKHNNTGFSLVRPSPPRFSLEEFPELSSKQGKSAISLSSSSTLSRVSKDVVDSPLATPFHGVRPFDTSPEFIVEDGATPLKPSYANRVRNNRLPPRNVEMHYFEPNEDGKPQLGKCDGALIAEKWGFCMVGCFSGRFPGGKAVYDVVNTWGVPCKIIPHTWGWTIFKFNNREDRELVMEQGPYISWGKTLMLKKIEEGMHLHHDLFLDIPVWVKFYNVPLTYWTPSGLSKIASKLGKPLFMDQITRDCERASFARILVEVNVRVKPITRYEVLLPDDDSYFQDVVYESFPDYCYVCKLFDHNCHNCQKLAKTEPKQADKVVPHCEPLPKSKDAPVKLSMSWVPTGRLIDIDKEVTPMNFTQVKSLHVDEGSSSRESPLKDKEKPVFNNQFSVLEECALEAEVSTEEVHETFLDEIQPAEQEIGKDNIEAMSAAPPIADGPVKDGFISMQGDDHESTYSSNAKLALDTSGTILQKMALLSARNDELMRDYEVVERLRVELSSDLADFPEIEGVTCMPEDDHEIHQKIAIFNTHNDELSRGFNDLERIKEQISTDLATLKANKARRKLELEGSLGSEDQLH